MSVWSTQNTLTINGMVIDKEQIEIADVLKIAKELKYNKFVVKDAQNGNLLNQNDFPYSNSITIEPYNEAAI